MKNCFSSIIVCTVLCLLSVSTYSSEPLESKLNPFIGTGGHGHTYPGATLPFGMVQLSPDTRLTGWDGCSAYHYSDTVVYGFSHTHLSGTGASDYGDILLMPVVGSLQLENGKDNPDNGYASQFSKDREKAAPGYYSVFLNDYGIQVELTATLRTGLHKYTFPESDSAHIILDLVHRDKVLNSSVRFVSDREIEGYRMSDRWANDQRIYFVIQCSKPFGSFGIETDGVMSAGLKGATGTQLKAWVDFSTKTDEAVLLKVGISAVSVEGARKNLNAENPGWDFTSTRLKALKAWERELSCISVQGGTGEQQTIFYTALYHSFLNPNIFSDVDGRYLGMDMEVHHSNSHTQYTVFSLWDTFRAEHPLFTIVQQKRTVNFIRTMLAQYQEGGSLPVWELGANETMCMIGYHSVPVIVDAWIKEIRDFDGELALEAMIHSAELPHLGLEEYMTHGFIPMEKEHESVSKTLEYSYDDWCIARMAESLGENDIEKRFYQRALYYRNVFDTKTGFMRPRFNGGWMSPFNPREVNFHYTEANSWQYSFFAPQDISGLIKLMGGDTLFIRKLDELFSETTETTGRTQVDITGLIGQYAHGNEPSHHMAYLYSYAGEPWKTQKTVRHIMDTLYTAEPDGLCGNEDCGQMSAWYVFSALGFYPVTPGSDMYVIGAPLFPVAVIRLENGKTFQIKAEGISDKNIYIQSALLNTKPLKYGFIHHKDIMEGGTLTFRMGPEPNTTLWTEDSQRPKAEIDDRRFLTGPVLSGHSETFTGQTQISMSQLDEEAEIFYAMVEYPEEDDFIEYTAPVTLTETTTLTAYAEKGRAKSLPVTGTFFKVPTHWKIKVLSTVNDQYTAGGERGLIDTIRGGDDFRNGRWQGYQSQDFEAIVDLEKATDIREIGGGFLQDVRSWIVMPTEVIVAVSDNGTDFTDMAVIKNIVPVKEGRFVRDFIHSFDNLNTRYVKITAKNYGKLPEWHQGAGGDAFIFIDEIIIR